MTQLPYKSNTKKSAMLSIWADYACSMTNDYFDIYFNHDSIGRIAQDGCLGSVGSFGYFNSKLFSTNKNSNPNLQVDSADALSDVSTLIGDTATQIVFEYDANNNTHFLCGYIFAYETQDQNLCQLNSTIKVFPTPFRDLLLVNNKSSTSGTKMIPYNTLGQLLIKDKVIPTGETTIFLNYLADGMYYYIIYSNNCRITGKILKQQ